MAEAEGKKYEFLVKVDGENKPYIFCQYMEEDDLAVLGNGSLGFVLSPEGHEKPSEVAEYLNANIEKITYTPCG